MDAGTLFVASVNSRFMTTFLAIAENSKLDFVSFKADAKGKLEKLDGHPCVAFCQFQKLGIRA